jgi:hypothetical protein
MRLKIGAPVSPGVIQKETITMFDVKVEKDGLLKIGPDVVSYVQHFISAATLENIIRKWVPLLQSLSAESNEVLLPYSLDDEFIEAFKATYRYGFVELRCVTLDAIGFDPEIDNAEEYVFQPWRVIKEYPKSFANFKKQLLLTAIRAV